ncbi:Ig-like domain-containing protein, partial [Teredinibacter waterburyi]|uniref:Ig-like domain-containing protein n=1 Tax=Teredinibacter waterburyi TaxID=1500538 RepID=UPI001CAA85C0
LSYSVAGNSNIGVSIDANGIATISSTADWNGSETITFTAEDEGGLTVDASADFIVGADNDAPTTSGLADQNLTEDFASYTIDLNDLFADAETADGDLSYSVAGNTNIGVS